MNIAYITEFDLKSLDRTAWRKSQLGHWGCCYYIAKFLEDEFTNVQYIGPLTKKYAVRVKLKRRLYDYLTNKIYHSWAEPIFNKDYAAQIKIKLSSLKSDVILSPDINFVSYLDCDLPSVIWVDSTYAGYINFYGNYSHLCRETVKHLTNMDKLALTKCKIAIFSSEWAAKKAIDTYGIEQYKVKVVPFGANLECKRTVDNIKSIVEAKPSSKCKLLFIGSDWIRKGGNVALEVTKNLNLMGLNTELTVVGCNPLLNQSLANFGTVLGVIDTFTPDGLNKINELLTEAHFLILPSSADCSPHVLAEANSFGIPCLATNVGGIPTIIKNDLNGRIFEVNTDIAEYSNYITSLFNNFNKYKELALSSFNEYQTRLNWAVSCNQIKHIMKKLL